MHWHRINRIHSTIGFLILKQKWEDFYSKTLFTFTLSGEAETGASGGQPARNNLTK